MNIPEGWPTEEMVDAGKKVAARLGIHATVTLFKEMIKAAPEPETPTQIDWPPECEALCKAAEEMQAAINELWKAQNLEELVTTDKPMTEEEARENHNDCWKTLTEAIYYMRKRMNRPIPLKALVSEMESDPEMKATLDEVRANLAKPLAKIFIVDGKMMGSTVEEPLPTGTYYLYSSEQKGLKVEFTKEWCMKMAQLEGDQAIGAGAPAQEDEPVAYGARNFMTKEFAPVLSENKDTIQNWVSDRHRSQDRITYEGPIPLYTRPDSSKLRKAAEEVLPLLDLLIRKYSLDADDYAALQNLRAALEGE